MESAASDDVGTDTVLKIAQLARIGLTPEEAAGFEGSIRSILDHFRQLAGAQIPPDLDTLGPLGPDVLLRDDVVTGGTFRADFLSGVPRRLGEFVVVPAVLPQDAATSES